MIPTSIIIDDIFSPHDFNFIQSKIKQNHIKYQWYDIVKNHEYASLCHSLINLAGQYYDVNDVIGYELWSHVNTLPPAGWHYDKDEEVYKKYKIYKFPVCSIVYYPIIENLIDGELILDKDIIVPKENRIVIFKPNTYHNVKEYQGNRYSIVINPWTTKLGLVSG